MPRREREALLDKAETFAAAPFAAHPAATPLRGQPDVIRLRQGDWRGICRVDRTADTIVLDGRTPKRGIPMSEKTETVTLSRAEYEALIERLEEAEDLATVAAAEAREAALGKEQARADYLSIELVRRLSAGEHPVRVWRAHRGLTREALAAAAGVAPSYLTEIETRRKPGSFGAFAKIAVALRISLDDLAAWLKPQE
jgi:hypothetical protein